MTSLSQCNDISVPVEILPWRVQSVRHLTEAENSVWIVLILCSSAHGMIYHMLRGTAVCLLARLSPFVTCALTTSSTSNPVFVVSEPSSLDVGPGFPCVCVDTELGQFFCFRPPRVLRYGHITSLCLPPTNASTIWIGANRT